MSTNNGRRLRRTHELCFGCHARLSTGEPQSTETWPASLSLTDRQVDLLLQAATEFEELAEEGQIISSAVDYVDWMAVDALPGLLNRVVQRERRDLVRAQAKGEAA